MTVKTQFELPPKDDVFRSFPIRLDEAGPDDGDTEDVSDVLTGHFARFNVLNEIDSFWEGNFMERLNPGAFRKTFKEQFSDIRCLLQHGYDPELGDKPIAVPETLVEDEVGPFYRAPILDGLSPLVIAGIRAGQYGASYRFKVLREVWDMEPGISDDNPKGLPIRDIIEVRVREFGPCTWGADPEATSMLEASLDSRSVVDDWILERLAQNPERIEQMVTQRAERMAAFGRAMESIRALETSPPNKGDEITPGDPEGNTPDEEPRREQDPDAPADGAEIPNATRKGKDYLSDQADKPDWLLS